MTGGSPRPVGPTLPILATVVWLAVFLVALLAGMFSVMIFDAGTENVQAAGWLLFSGIWATIALCPLSIMAGWVAWGLTRQRRGGGSRWLRGVLYCLPMVGLMLTGASLLGS